MGIDVAAVVGTADEVDAGAVDEAVVGAAVGAAVGADVGAAAGAAVGAGVGGVGYEDGNHFGDGVGVGVGGSVGRGVGDTSVLALDTVLDTTLATVLCEVYRRRRLLRAACIQQSSTIFIEAECPRTASFTYWIIICFETSSEVSPACLAALYARYAA